MKTIASPQIAPPHSPQVGPKPWGIPAIIVALILPVLLWSSALVLNSVVDTDQEISDGELITSLIVTIIVLDGGFIALAAGLSLRKYRLRWSALGFRSFNLNQWWLPVAAAGGAYLGIIVYSIGLTIIGADAAVPEQEELDQLFRSKTVLPLTGLATIVMAPLAEEIFFRGFIFGGLIRPIGPLFAMAVSGLIFAMFHVSGVDTIGLLLPFGAIGALFAWLYYRTGSIYPSMIAHFLFNTVSFIALASVAAS